MKKNSIFCTLGPSSLNKTFLKFSEKNKISLLRLNLSHLSIKKLKKNIKFIKKNCNIPICIDTEGAQIRTKIKFQKYFKKKQIGTINKLQNKGFSFYPENIFEKIKIGDQLIIGFAGLKIKIIKKNKLNLYFKTIASGLLENNKGVHLINSKIKINYLTNKDLHAIEISKKFNIKYFALSFTNSLNDVIKFSKLLPKQKKIYKIETKKALYNFNKLIKYGDYFLIDRGDLSQDINIDQIPSAQREIISISKKFKNKKIYVATNLLESMIKSPIPTRAEANDIFNTLEMGASGLVLAAETAIGKYPEQCIQFIKKIISNFKKFK